MLWAIFPIFAQFFYTSGSYIENYLADLALPNKRAGALIIGRLPGHLLLMLLLFAVFGRAVFILPINSALGLILAGAINIVGSILFFKAFQAGDTADVGIFNQLSPVISLGLGVLVLNETITAMQAVGLAIIMAATSIIIFGGMSKKDHHAPNLKVAMLTIIAAFFSILSDVVYAFFVKDYTADITLLGQGLFFFEIGSALMTTVITICFRSWRKAFRKAFLTGRGHKKYSAALVVDNLTFIAAELLYKYGLIVVPVVAMMTAISKVASLFVSFFYTLFLGRIFPKFINGKRITRKIMAQYLFAAVLIVVGIVVMN